MHNFFSESQILRLLVTGSEKNKEERKNLLDRRLASLSQGHFSDVKFNPVCPICLPMHFIS